MYVLPIACNVCSYTTLAEMLNFHVFNDQYSFYFHSTFCCSRA